VTLENGERTTGWVPNVERTDDPINAGSRNDCIIVLVPIMCQNLGRRRWLAGGW
jgi:hypothetical protein